MSVKAGILIIIGFMVLVGTVSANVPDLSTITASDSWVIANGVDSTLITVTALNTSAPFHIKNAIVEFSVDNPIYGSVSPSSKKTDNSGIAKSTFKVNKTSGVVNISAKITSPDGYTVRIYQNVNIDHDVPYYPYFSHPLSGTVATEVPFNISITDRWGNRIDNRRGNHTISLHVHGPAPDDCSFSGYGHNIPSLTLDPNGNQSVNVMLTTKVGPNNILMDSFGSIGDKLRWINADTNGIPFSISQAYTPSGSPPSLPADSSSKFTIIYSLLDRYKNPAGQQWVWINTSITGEAYKFQSNNLGQILITYGPKSSVGVINITATTVGNSTVKISQQVEFTNTAAANMELTANPETMASRDVDPLITSDITATVTDSLGNPVENELVTFSLGVVGYPGGPYNVTSSPQLVSNSTITDANGYATVQFIPGSFSTNSSNISYSSSATGNVTITATWNSTPKKLLVTWKNYPYLSVKTSVNPPTIAINDTVEVTIALKGDGWALGPKPIDAILVIDRSGSMSAYNVAPGVTRMQAAKDAAKTFVTKMNSGTDRVGLVSYSYENSVTLDAALGTSFTTINSKIDGLSSGGGTAMREGFNRSLAEMISKPKAGAIRAVILMTDGNWNNGGSPLAVGKGYQDIAWVTNNRAIDVGGNRYNGFSSLAIQFEDEDYRWYSGRGGNITTGNNVQVVRKPVEVDPNSGAQTSARTYQTLNNVPYCQDGQFTSQNISVYAKANNIRLYTISFAQNVPASERTALTVLANATGGFYKHAPTQADLATVYQQIAGDLKDEAGVNTTMLADYQNINVTGISLPGAQVFKYISHPTYSTRIGWQDGVINVTNQSADWTANNKLDFTIGTIKVGQIWNATFRLKANQSGSIDVFGANSLLSFNGGASTLTIPHTFLTVVPQLNMTIIGSKTLDLDNLLVTQQGEITTLVPFMWNTSYTGNKTILEQVYYSADNGPWILFHTQSHPYPYAPDIISATEYVDNAQLDVRKLPPGGYKIKVYATASDAPDDQILTDATRVGGAGKTYIKLEAPPFEFRVFDQNMKNPWSISHDWMV